MSHFGYLLEVGLHCKALAVEYAPWIGNVLTTHEDLAGMSEREYEDYLGRTERWA